MSRRRPWETPVVYEEDRFDDKHSLAGQQPSGFVQPDPDLVVSRVRNPQADRKEPKPRPTPPVKHEDASTDAERPEAPAAPRRNWRDADGGRSNDDRPLNYGRGPHDGELDVDDRDDLYQDED